MHGAGPHRDPTHEGEERNVVVDGDGVDGDGEDADRPGHAHDDERLARGDREDAAAEKRGHEHLHQPHLARGALREEGAEGDGGADRREEHEDRGGERLGRGGVEDAW